MSIKHDGENWTPSESDIQFINNIIDTLRDGGVWGLPATGHVFRINKPQRVMTLIAGPAMDTSNVLSRTSIILEKLGWKLEL